jgi:hypothetical protein
VSGPRFPNSEFVRRIHRDHGEAARAAEVGLRALHAELAEQRSPVRAVTARAHQAQELGDEVAARRLLRAREGRRSR